MFKSRRKVLIIFRGDCLVDYAAILAKIYEDLTPYLKQGEPASYIPALASVDPDQFGLSLHTVDGEEHLLGDACIPFSVQSISKVFMLTLAMNFEGEGVWKRLGREPSGNPFNSLVQLEYEHGIPRNPFINAGAMVITDIVMTHCGDVKSLLLDFVRRLSGNSAIYFDEQVAASERDWGHRNRALCNFLKAYGNIYNDVEAVLDTYFYQCSLAMTCRDLSKLFLIFANQGKSPITGEQVVAHTIAKRINALMLTCGLYDEGGDFAFRVGLPGKSGVGGGICAVLPNELAISVWGPRLNPAHNSLAGIKALEWFTTETGRSIF